MSQDGASFCTEWRKALKSMTEPHHPAFARTTVIKHNQGVLIIAVAVVLFQCSQSALHHLDLKHHQKIEYLSKKYHTFFINQDDVAGGGDVVKSLAENSGRARRQNIEGDPQAYTSELSADTHHFAQTVYVGKGSEVSIYIYIYKRLLKKLKI